MKKEYKKRICLECGGIVDGKKEKIYCNIKCKEKSKNKRWNKNNKEKRIFYNQEYYKKNKERLKPIREKWTSENKERIKEYNKKWISENRDKIKKIHKKWKNNNKEKVRAGKIAIRNIKIPKNKLCEKCGIRLAKVRHHEDYKKPLDIIFLCVLCHNKRHKELKNFKRRLQNAKSI